MDNKISKIFPLEERGDLIKNICKLYNKYEEDFLYEGSIQIDKFKDGEFEISFKESVRGLNTYLVCSTSSSDNIIKLLLSIDAARRSSAGQIIAIIPYLGYSRQDQKRMRGSSGASLLARILEESGVNRVITIDLHSDQIESFFKVPLDHIRNTYLYSEYIKNLSENNITLCSPDAGGVKRVDNILKILNKNNSDINMVILSKRRDKPNSISSMELIGNVKDRNVIIIDDIVDTAGTLCMAADKIMDAGAKSVICICTHGILSDPALDRINKSSMKKLVITNSIYRDSINSNKIEILSISNSLCNIIKAINNNKSINRIEGRNI